MMITDDLFEPFKKLVEIEILGEKMEVPEKNLLLRCFQYLSPESIPTVIFAGTAIVQNVRFG